MRRYLAAVFVLAALQHAAYAFSPNDFFGNWKVTRMVGASDVGTGEDFHKLLGTTLTWSGNAVRDADGVCAIVHPTVSLIPTDALQHGIWGGQTIADLNLPKTTIARAFGKTETPVFDDGGKGCARAVMLNHNQLLLMFGNGYLYLLDRDARK